VRNWTGYSQFDSLPDRPPEDALLDWLVILAVMVALVAIGVLSAQ
jgi:hypothetical protein